MRWHMHLQVILGGHGSNVSGWHTSPKAGSGEPTKSKVTHGCGCPDGKRVVIAHLEIEIK